MNAGLILFLIFILCLVIGVPVSISLSVASLAVAVFGGLPASSTAVAQRIFDGLQSSSIMTIIFFVLTGNLTTEGGISRQIVDFADRLVGNVRGGMNLALVLACAFFATLSGSAPATVIAIGTVLYGDMIKKGYPGPRTAGLLVVSGEPEPIVPPSIIMVIYCTLTGASVGNMFKQGMMIGIVIMLILMMEVLQLTHKEKWPRQNVKRTPAGVVKVFLDAIPALLTPIVILGGIYSGMLTTAEDAAVAVVWTAITGAFIYRELNLPGTIQIIKDSAKSPAMILFIVVAPTAFSWVFVISGASKTLVGTMTGMNLNTTIFYLVTAVILLIFGTFMEGTVIAVLLVPVLQPIVQSMDINVMHFGMVVYISNVMGTMTPPVAVNIYSAATASKLKIGEITKAEIPFLVSYVEVFFLCVFSEWFCAFLT